jgi:hypothetical protein
MDNLGSFGSSNSILWLSTTIGDCRSAKNTCRNLYSPGHRVPQRVIIRTVIDRVYRQQISYYVNNNLMLVMLL